MIQRFSLRLRAPAAALAVLCVAIAATSNVWGASQLSGYVYIDRNNDGLLAFADQAQPEWVLSGVEIKLYSVAGTTETLLSTVLTDGVGQYLFSGLSAGTYAIRQTQPIEYVDGIDTLGIIRELNGSAVPSGANVGTVDVNAFLNIALTTDSRGDFYNFGERGLTAAYASKRYLLSTAPVPVVIPDPELNGAIPEPTTATLAVVAGLSMTALKRRARTVLSPVHGRSNS